VSLSAEALRLESGRTGFRPEILEKVDRLLDLLEAMQKHPYLKNRLVLKGGTALNLFIFDVPRLSVDIDLNYIGAADRETMLAERPLLERAMDAVAGRLGLTLQRAPTAHAGGKWRLRYAGVLGQGGTLELDINWYDLIRRSNGHSVYWMSAARRYPGFCHSAVPSGNFWIDCWTTAKSGRTSWNWKQTLLS